MCKEHATYYKEEAVAGDETSRRICARLAMCLEEERWEAAARTAMLHAVETDLLRFSGRKKSRLLR